MHQIRFRLGLRPNLAGELTALSQTLELYLRAYNFKGEGERKWSGRGKEGTYEGKGGSGREGTEEDTHRFLRGLTPGASSLDPTRPRDPQVYSPQMKIPGAATDYAFDSSRILH